MQAGSNRDPQIGDGAIARDFVGDRLLHTAQVIVSWMTNQKRPVEIRREAAAHDDAAGDRSRDHHRRENVCRAARLRATGIDRAP